MERVNVFLFGNEVELDLSSLRTNDRYFIFENNLISVYKKNSKGSVFVKTVENYGELYNVKNIDNGERRNVVHNFILLNP